MAMKFKNLGGPHVERGRQIGLDAAGVPAFAEVTYERGEVVETDIDLAKKFNPKGSPAMAKFTRLADTSKATYKEFSRFTKAPKAEPIDPEAVDALADEEELEQEDEEVLAEEDEEEVDEEGGIGNDTLSSMTVAELRLHAGSEGIPLHGVTTKADILKAIRSGQ